jgi:glucose/mannose transport system permease protein
MLPRYDFVGLKQHIRLWSQWRWYNAVENLLIFTVLFIAICIIIGIFLSILLDQKIRAEGFLRTVYLYPMALSFIVTGTAWKWILNPTMGIQKLVRDWGFTDFTFDWLVNRDMSIYTIVIAAVWQSSGFVMALFLAGLRSIDDEIIKAAKIDGASLYSIYITIILPMLRPVFMSAIVILLHISIKSYDLVIALTAGGPGTSSDMPAVYMTQMAFHRSEIALASASAVMMFLTILAIVVPYLYSELRRQDANR